MIARTGIRREVARPIAIFALAAGSLLVTLSAIIGLLLFSIIPGGGSVGLATFYTVAASNAGILFFATFMAASAGSGLIAEDRRTMALSLYLSRPITPADYLAAKALILATLMAMICALPLILTPLVAALLGRVGWDIGLEALGIGIGLGLLLTAFFTSVTMFLSSLTSRRAYAAAGVFAITFGLTVPVEILAGSLNQQSLLYLSPWQDYLAVAAAALQAPAQGIDWVPALLILIVPTIVFAMITYARIQDLEVSTE